MSVKALTIESNTTRRMIALARGEDPEAPVQTPKLADEQRAAIARSYLEDIGKKFSDDELRVLGDLLDTEVDSGNVVTKIIAKLEALKSEIAAQANVQRSVKAAALDADGVAMNKADIFDLSDAQCQRLRSMVSREARRMALSNGRDVPRRTSDDDYDPGVTRDMIRMAGGEA